MVDGCEGGYLRCEVLEQRGVQLEGVVSDLKGQGQGRGRGVKGEVSWILTVLCRDEEQSMY